MFVLDEADEMLSRGFKDQIYDVFRKLPSSIQVVLLSATMPQDVLEVTKRFMRDPIRILVKKEELTLEGIKQFYVQVEKEVGGWEGGCRERAWPSAGWERGCGHQWVREGVAISGLGEGVAISGLGEGVAISGLGGCVAILCTVSMSTNYLTYTSGRQHCVCLPSLAGHVVCSIRSGSWTLYVISTRPSQSPKQSFLLIPVGKWTG